MKIITIKYSTLESEAKKYWTWHKANPIPPMPHLVALEGAGSEARTPLMHFGAVVPVYLTIIRYLKQVRPRKGTKLIELGTGTGRLLSYLKTVFPQLGAWGSDYSAAAVDYAQKSYAQFGVKFQHAKAQKTTFPDRSFDYVISSHVIEHIPKQNALSFIKEVARLLKKGGYAFIGTPERKRCQEIYLKNVNDDPRYRLIPPHQHEYTFLELKNLAQQVFDAKNVKIDKLNNPLFHSIFSSSIDKFKPGGGMTNRFMNFCYTITRDLLPRTTFDAITRLGINISMKRRGITYQNVLESNRIDPEETRKIPDNLLLVCQK